MACTQNENRYPILRSQPSTGYTQILHGFSQGIQWI